MRRESLRLARPFERQRRAEGRAIVTTDHPQRNNGPKDRWFPREPLAHWIQWLLLLLSTFTILTNAYFVRFAEGAVSRKVLAYALVALAGVWMILRRYGTPRSGAQVLDLLRWYSTPLLLGVILLVAFGLRLWDIGYGLPQSYIPDEYDYVHSYLQMIKRGDLNPHWWFHPSLKAYVNVITYLVVFFVKAPSGAWSSVQQLTVEDMLYWGRLAAGVLPGTAVVLVSFFMGRRLFGTGVGLIGAALLAVFPGAVEASQYNKPDSLLILMTAVSVLAVMNYMDQGGRSLAFACGIAIGLTAAAKYNGAFVLLPFLLGVLLRRGLNSLTTPDLYLGAVGSIAGFFVGCPFFLADLARFLDHVADGLWAYGYLGHEGAQGVDNWFHHARYSALYGTGLVSLVASLAGLGLTLYRLNPQLAVFLTFPVLYYAYYSSQRIIFPGNLIPVYPFLALLAAYAVYELASLLAGLLRKRLKDPAGLLAEPVVLAGLLVAHLGSLST